MREITNRDGHTQFEQSRTSSGYTTQDKLSRRGQLLRGGHREDVVQHEGTNEAGHDRGALALERGFQSQG